jgi:phage baseplate assembly protein W
MNPIGILLPIKHGPMGYFNQSYDSISQIKSNIINLLRTNSGERRMQPTFSGGLQEALFEQNLKDSPELVKKIIEGKIKMWIPGIKVENIDLNLSDVEKNDIIDTYKMYITIKFTINNQTDVVSLSVTSNNI